MIFERHYTVSILRKRISSPIIMGLLCLFFLISSFMVIPTNCGASEMEGKHKHPSHPSPGTILNHLSIPFSHVKHSCSCAFGVTPCCEDSLNTTPKKAYVSLHSGKNLRPSTEVQTAMIPASSYYTGFRDRTRLVDNPDCYHKKEPFIINCTLLI